MKSLLKSMLAILLGLGFLVLQSRAQAPSQGPATKRNAVAFLGLTGSSDPQLGEVITERIRGRLMSDSSINGIPREAVERLFSKGILRGPDIRPDDPQALRREVGEAYLAYGSLEQVSLASKRTWWKPWSVKNTWSQGMRLHVAVGATGLVVLDSLVVAAVREAGFVFTPEKDLEKIPPLERDRRLRIMADAVSLEAANALANVMKARPPLASAPR